MDPEFVEGNVGVDCPGCGVPSSLNVIAYTNNLSADGGTRLEIHLSDWIKQIG